MHAHGRLVDMGLQGGVVVGKRRHLVRHLSSFVVFLLGLY
jgi:hypothetical protein